jgi:hypothetical protein
MPSTLATSTQYKVWRGFQPAVARPPAVPSTKITDQVGLGLVRCAKTDWIRLWAEDRAVITQG